MTMRENALQLVNQILNLNNKIELEIKIIENRE